MIFDPQDALDALRAEAEKLVEGVDTAGLPDGAPVSEYTRSPAAWRTARLGGEIGLRLFHYEHRAQLELPEDWVPADHPELVSPPSWQGGILPERKYHSFRHDQVIGGFHPGHRAKWSTHELAHGLAGFGWSPDPTPLFLATAGRLAELVPVVLYYFLDEVFLARCPIHRHGGALYRSFCPDCEACAATTLDDPRALERLTDASRYLDRELAAVARTRRLGRPVPHIHGSLDLCSDGIAYAVAHGERLRSEAFHRWIAIHATEETGWWASLDALESRVEAVAKAIVGVEDLPAVVPDPGVGRRRWVVQDVAWRLWSLWHECSAEVQVKLEMLCARLEAGGEISEVAESYQELTREYVVPDAEDLFAVGYDLGEGWGRSRRQVGEGLEESCPLTLTLLEDASETDAIARFVAQDDCVRASLPERWAAWWSGPLGEVARYEAALLSARAPEPEAALGRWTSGPARLSRGARIVRSRVDLVDLAHRVEIGEIAARKAGEGLTLEAVAGAPVEEGEHALVFGRTPDNEPIVVDILPELAEQLQQLGDGGPLDIPEEHRVLLGELGLVLPARFQL